MGLKKEDRQELSEARKAVKAARSSVEMAKTMAVAVHGPKHRGKPDVPEAYAAAQAAAAKADAALDAARGVFAKHRPDELLAKARAAAEEAGDLKAELEANIESLREAGKKALRALSAARLDKKEAEESPAAANLAVEKKKLSELRTELRRTKEALAQIREKGEIARAEIKAAREAFEGASKAASAIEGCWLGLKPLWYGTEKAKADAKAALDEKILSRGAEADEFAELEARIAGIERQVNIQKELTDKTQRLRDEAESKQSAASARIEILEADQERTERRIAGAERKLAEAAQEQASAKEEASQLQDLAAIGDEIEAASERVSALRSAARNLLYETFTPAQRTVEQQIERDIETKLDAFQGLSANEKTAIKDFREGRRGGAAKRLAPLLDGKSRAEVLQTMQQEVAGRGATETANNKWEYPDGTVVRYKPNGDEYSAGRPTYSLEVKTDTARADQGLDDVACKVDPRGRAVPKHPGQLRNAYAADDPKAAPFRDGVMSLGHRIL